jgi:hypothetical protein
MLHLAAHSSGHNYGEFVRFAHSFETFDKLIPRRAVAIK